jgi:hypothetical protein
MLFFKLQVPVLLCTICITFCDELSRNRLVSLLLSKKSKKVGFCYHDAVYMLVLTDFNKTCFTNMPLENAPSPYFLIACNW